MGLRNTVIGMIEELNERQRREEANARRREQRQAAREAEAVRESESSEGSTNSLLGFATNQPRTEESIRNRYAGDMRDRLRNRPRPGPTRRGFPSASTSQPEYQPEVASYHNSRYAGNANDQGQPYYMPPPLDVGYDIGMVLANMNQRFLENRERVQKQRAIQVAQFQAANRVRQEQAQEQTPGVVTNTETPTTTGPTPVVPGATNSPPDALAGSSNATGGTAYGSEINRLSNAGTALSNNDIWRYRNPILWGNGMNNMPSWSGS